MTRAHTVLAAYALLALIVIPIYPHFVSPNELARWLLDASLVEHGTIEVTPLAPMLGPRFEDLAEMDGRLYANKAPGAAFVALPGYLIARAFAGPPSPRSIRPVVTAMRLCASTLPLLALGWLMIRLGRRWGADDERIATVVGILLFATPLFAYGLILFSHALVAAALFGAWLCIEEKRDALAGALMGLAVISEYPAIVPVLILLVSVGRWPFAVGRGVGTSTVDGKPPTAKTVRRVARMIAAAAPFAVALAIYHHAAYGSIFGLPFGHDTLPQFRDLAGHGVAGISFPSPITLLRLLFDPARGLLIFAPVLVMSIPAMRTVPRSLVAIPLSLIVLYSGYPNWHGGWAVGPRYLVPAIPFLVAPLLLRKGGRVETVLVGFSVVAVVVTTLVFPFPPNAFAFPWMSLAIPLLGTGLVAPNLFHLVARPLAIALPFAIALAAAIVALTRRHRAYALIGALLAVILGAQWPIVSRVPAVLLQRMYIMEVYFEQPHSLPVNAPSSLTRRRDAEMRLPPPSWPF